MKTPRTSLTRAHVLQAIEHLANGHQHNFSESREYDFVYEGRRFPSKAVYGVACEIATGRQYFPKDLRSTNCIHRLRALDFDVGPKEEVGRGRRTALFINGVFEAVLDEILQSQARSPDASFYLQPYKNAKIRMLESGAPTEEAPIKLYLSTTGNLNVVSYSAEIVRWENKDKMPAVRKAELVQLIGRHQPSELRYFQGQQADGPGSSINLITIRKLRKLSNALSVQVLDKKSDGLPRGKRPLSGGWSEVYEVEALDVVEAKTSEQYNRDFQRKIVEAERTENELRQRLLSAPKRPEKVQIVSIGFNRNPDVVAAALLRARGRCERCERNAPFVRRANRQPYLEVHHVIPLSEEGEDTLDNVLALCPNCHREEHFG